MHRSVKSLGFKDSVISFLCYEGKVSEALNNFKVSCSDGKLPPISECVTLMSSFSEDLNSVVFVYKEIVKSGVVITVDALNCLIYALFVAGEVDLAVDQFFRMKRKGCAPNLKTFEIVIENLCVNGRVEESSVVLDEMIECGCKPDCGFLGKVLPLFCKFNRLVESKKLHQMMRKFDLLLNSQIYSDLIRCFCENEELDGALNLLDEMSERGITPGRDVYGFIINSFSRLGRFSEAEMFIESNNVLESQPHNDLITCYCREYKFHSASNYLTRMIDKGVGDYSSWNILITALCLDARNPRKASEVVSKMIILGYLPDTITFSSLISGYSKVGDIKNANLYFHLVNSESWDLDSDSYSDLIQALFRKNMIQEGIMVFQYMLSRSQHHSLPTSTVDFLISHMCRNGLVKDAIRLRSTSFSNGSTASSVSTSSILLGLLEVNRPELSRVLLSQTIVEDCSLDIETYCLFIRTMVSIGGKSDDLIILLKQMIDKKLAPDSETMIFLLKYIENLSQMKKVVPILDNPVFQGKNLNSLAYNVIVKGLINEGHNQDACTFLDQMLEQGWIPDADTHRLLVGGIGRERKVNLPERREIDDSLINLLAEGLRNR